MKDFPIFLFIIVFGWFSIPALTVSASDGPRSEHASAMKVLDLSLSRLKESVEKTVQKNERLSFENAALRGAIEDLKGVREFYAARKAELLDVPYSSRQKSATRNHIDMNDLVSRTQRTQELINTFESDIAWMKRELQRLDTVLSGREDGKDVEKDLIARQTQNTKNIARAEKKLDSLVHRNEGYNKVFLELRQKQAELVHELDRIQGGWRGH